MQPLTLSLSPRAKQLCSTLRAMEFKCTLNSKATPLETWAKIWLLFLKAHVTNSDNVFWSYSHSRLLPDPPPPLQPSVARLSQMTNKSRHGVLILILVMKTWLYACPARSYHTINLLFFIYILPRSFLLSFHSVHHTFTVFLQDCLSVCLLLGWLAQGISLSFSPVFFSLEPLDASSSLFSVLQPCLSPTA